METSSGKLGAWQANQSERPPGLQALPGGSGWVEPSPGEGLAGAETAQLMARMSGGSAPGWAGRGSGAAPGPAPPGSIPALGGDIPGLRSGAAGTGPRALPGPRGQEASRGWGDPWIPGLSSGTPGRRGGLCPVPTAGREGPGGRRAPPSPWERTRLGGCRGRPGLPALPADP